MNMPLHLITGHKGEAHISSADMGAFNAGMFGQGDYVLDIGRKFEAEAVSNNTIKIFLPTSFIILLFFCKITISCRPNRHIYRCKNVAFCIRSTNLV